MKRFTATEKWEKTWFQDLPPHIKCLWLYLCDKCDCAGVWEMNWKAASLFIGKAVCEKDLHYFERRVATFNGKLVIGDFIAFQFGKLSEDCRAHIPIFRALAKHSLSIAYAKAIHSLKEEEEEEEEEEDQETEAETEGGMQGGGEDPPAIPTIPTPRALREAAQVKTIAKAMKLEIPKELQTEKFELAWHDWIENRRQAKTKPYTELGMKGQLANLAIMGPERAIAAIRNSIANGYQGIFEPKRVEKNAAISTIPGEHENILKGVKIL